MYFYIIQSTFVLCFFLILPYSFPFNRQIQFLQHYMDHMKLHDNPLQHFCYHLDCNKRFLTPQELKDHVNVHQPLRARCQFPDCEKIFPSLQNVYDHEWRHYIPAPQRDELEKLSKQKKQNAEAPWKQKVKVEEIWLQNKKGPKESFATDNVEAAKCEEFNENKTNDQPCEASDALEPTDLENSKEIKPLIETNDEEFTQDLSCEDSCSGETSALNGYEDETRNQASQGNTAATPGRKRSKKKPVEVDPINVRDHMDMTTMSEGVQKSLGEPHITEHKSFQPEDPSYATFVKAPFIRPPPSTYLDESVLSMRKRRATEELSSKKHTYWSNKKKETGPEKESQSNTIASPEQKTRTRCDKCLSSFSSSEELEKHKALNTCSALFGFDSDDESK